MAPKRKRAVEGEPSTSSARATRSSTRQTVKTTDTFASTRSQALKKPVVGDSEEDTPTPPKKTKKSTTKSSGALKKSNAKTKHTLPKDDVNQELSSGGADKVSSSKSQLKTEPYSAAHVQALFSTYQDRDDPDNIGAENFGQLCADANIPMEGSMPLILFWYLESKEFGNITRDEWTKGMESLKVSSLPPLRTFLVEVHDLLFTTSPAKVMKKKDDGKESYDRSHYSAYAKDRQGTFSKFYISCFLLVKTGQSRNIEMETAIAFWSVLLTPQYPIMNEVISFIKDERSYKAVNKDVWSMMLEFCKTVGPSLESYEADGAWPTLLDDFVSWKKGQAGGKDDGNKDEDGQKS